MGKKIYLFVLITVYLLYVYAISTNNNLIGDILSPVLLFIISGFVFYGFVINQKVRILKWFGWLLTSSVFLWFLLDFWWGIQTLLLHSNPEENIFTVYGYSLTSVILFISIIFSGSQDLRKMHKIQAMLDM